MFLTKTRLKRILSTVALIAVMALSPATVAQAACAAGQDTCDSSYGVSGAAFTSGADFTGNMCDGSGNCAIGSAGQNAAGLSCDATSGGFCTQAGFNTSLPYIELDITGNPNVDVGVLKDNETHVGTATFSVKTYLAQGYQVTTSSPGPKNGSYAMQLMGTPGAGAAGTEGFGMNVVANSCPAAAPALPTKGGCTTSFGADPSQNPDSTFSYGNAASGYDTANSYKYQDQSIIAQSAKSTSFTDYTISYLFNISGVTPAGTYTMNQSIVATSTF
jgi:hypothetical protein